jgi:hypothetical protein
MILVFRKGLEYNGSMNGLPENQDENIFPIMSVPLDLEGEETDLNDFQWWAYSDKWKEWLEDNPREWQAESHDVRFDKAEQILEGIVTAKNPVTEYVSHQAKSLWNNGEVSSFSDYVKMLEAESTSGSRDAAKKFIKLGYALEKLAKEGKLKDVLKMEDLEDDKEYAVVVDPMTESGDPVQEARQALRIKKIGDSAGIIIAEVDYSIPLGEVEDTKDFMDKVAEFAKDVAIGGAGLAALYGVAQVAGSLYLGWRLLKGARGIYRNFGRARRIHGAISSVRGTAAPAWNSVRQFATRAFTRRAGAQAVANAARITLPSGAFVEGGLAYSTRATGNVLLKGAAEKSVKSAAQRLVAQGGARAATAVAGRGAVAAGASTAVAAEASNPVGWILLAAQVIGSGINQVWNWYSDKQAPRYGEVEDFAYGSFNPKLIPVGKAITVCWTSDGGAGWGEYILDILTMSKDDTRTTMELVKLGEFDDRSVFVMLQVNSEMFEKAMKDNDLILLSFANNDKFERGTFDNDDLEFQTIVIPDITELTIGTSFVGYSTWTEMKEAYKESPDSPIYVPSGARKDYQFHYTDADGNDVNVTGTLVNENEISDTVLQDLVPGAAGAVDESATSGLDYSHLVNESKVLSFKDFSIRTNPIMEEDAANAEDAENTENAEGVESAEENTYEDDLLTSVSAASALEAEYSQIPVLAYRVNTISFVDPTVNENVDQFNYFIIGEQSMDPKINQPILVESASEAGIEDPRFGLKTYVPPAPEEDDKDEEAPEVEDTEVIDIEGVDEPSSKSVQTARGDVQIKSKTGSLTIKDRDMEGGINIFDEFATSDLKKDLNIEDWKNITSVRVRYDKDEEPIKVVLKNRFAKAGDKRRVIRKGEQGFDSALSFAETVEGGISFSG